MKSTSKIDKYTSQFLTYNLTDRPDVLVQLHRFPKGYRDQMQDFAAQCRETADLVISYPAFAVALVQEYGSADDAQTIIALLKSGESSKKLADLYGLPRWLRKVPPEALVCRFPTFSNNETFNRHMMACVPTNPAAIPHWFLWVTKALAVASEDFTLWLAKQDIFGALTNPISRYVPKRGQLPVSDLLAPLLLYAWHSENDHIEGMAVRWTKKMQFHNALIGAGQWINSQNIHNLTSLHNYYREEMLDKAVRARQKPWVQKSFFKGYYFEPLMDYQALYLEGVAMNHCAAEYEDYIARDLCGIFSVKNARKQPIATLELVRIKNDGYKAEIVQIQGKNNAYPSFEIIALCQEWLAFNACKNKVRVSALPNHKGGTQSFKIRWDNYWVDHPKELSDSCKHRWQSVSFLEQSLMFLSKMNTNKAQK